MFKQRGAIQHKQEQGILENVQGGLRNNQTGLLKIEYAVDGLNIQ